jgi:hypothetical protein
MTEVTTTERPFNQTQLWLWWVLATAGGWLGAYWISGLLNVLVLNLLQIDLAALAGSESLPESVQLPLLFLQLATLFVVGVVVGGAQWFILRRQIPQIGRWPLFTAFGCLITVFAGPFALLLVGLGMGLLQWLILRNVLNRTGWWSPISAGAWVLGYFLGNMAGALLINVLDIALAQLIAYATVGIVGGALTGVALLWLLRENAGLLESLRQEREAETAKR